VILEVFSCSGGMAEGLRRAGLSVDVAIDADTDACESYAANLGHRPVQVDAREFLRLLQTIYSVPVCDLLIADPPCTPWSRAGKRKGRDDDRDMLDVTVSLVREIAPRAFLIANVPGLDDGPNWPIVQSTIGSLTRDGYCIDFARLDAADYGVPQHRVRPFWYGHREGPCIQWPARTHAHPDACGATLPGIISAFRPWVTCRQALGHLSPEDLGAPVRLRWRGGPKTSHAPRALHVDGPAHVVTSKDTAGDGNILFAGPNHRPSRADAPSATVTARDRGLQGAGALLVHDRHPVSDHDAPARTITAGDGGGSKGARTMTWPWDRPSTTVCAGIDKIAAANEHAGHLGPNAIKLSEKAAAILQGFPEGWTFAGETKRARWSQIGQAMPPPLAEAVGRSIVAQMAKARARVA
jgi:site-specific DNA-cytosine methylase